jgi:hypothetical protein
MLLAMSHGETMELFSLYKFLISYIQITSLVRTMERNDRGYIPYACKYLKIGNSSSYPY